MNMHGIFTLPPAEDRFRPSPVRRLFDWVRMRRAFLLVVALPTLLLAAYFYLVAADQYQSEAHFIVRGVDSTPAVGTGLGQVLGLAGGLSPTASDAASVSDYLESHDVVATLRRSADLVARFRRPEADLVSRLREADPTPERLLKYYRGKVGARTDADTGITTLTVRAFRPEDAFTINKLLLRLGEERVNQLNRRSYDDAVAASRRRLAEAEAAVAAIQGRITRFRQSRGDIDPQGSGQAQIGLVSRLQTDLSGGRAQLAAMGQLISPSSPQYVALARHVRSLEAEVARQSGRLAGGGGTIATDLGGYEDLRVRQEFAAKQYEAAAASLEKSREQAQRQQLYLVRVVDANLPVKSLFPQRERVLLTVFLGLLLAYGIGWLIVAGVREHAA